MKSIEKVKSCAAYIVLVVTVLLSTSAWAESYTVGYVDSVSFSSGVIEVADQSFVFDDLIQIKRHGEDYRLPVSSLRTGTLIAVVSRFDEKVQGLRVLKVILLPNDEIAQRYKKTGEGD